MTALLAIRFPNSDILIKNITTHIIKTLVNHSRTEINGCQSGQTRAGIPFLMLD
ncbi:hypothetical protein EVA_14720 [gut metagenome]|uniref:Uncharacterized protein n=1 Tax=gut metagenome TaxID=749906 RepID=J9GCQ3_9ZZZZ